MTQQNTLSTRERGINIRTFLWGAYFSNHGYELCRERRRTKFLMRLRKIFSAACQSVKYSVRVIS